MKNQLIKLFKEFQYNYYFLNFDQSIDLIIKEVEKDLLKDIYSIEFSRSLITRLWQLQKSLKIEELEKTKEYSCILNNILTDSSYSVSQNFIECTKFISCTAIKTSNNFYILDDNQINKLISMGYGIKKYRIEKSLKIRNIYCDGKHPNLDIKNNSFCIGSNLVDTDVNDKNLKIVEEFLSQFNLTSTYIDKKELTSILEVVE